MDIDSQPNNQDLPNYLEEATKLERQALEFQQKGDVQKAFELYDQAAHIYKEAKDYLKAAVCFSAAATCWNIHTGWQPLHHAATRNHMAAEQAMNGRHYDYARTLFRDAALLYEREGDFESYSECFLESQKADRKRSFELWWQRKFTDDMSYSEESVGVLVRLKWFFRWILNHASNLIWGFGERPGNTLLTAVGIVFVSACIYYFSKGLTFVAGGHHFLDSIYFSVVTFTTVGYGDIVAVGMTRMVAMLEALSGIIVTPLFLIGLTRRYLRMYR